MPTPNQDLSVKPRAGLIVRNPDTGAALPAKGARVPNTAYWRRRLACGDVVARGGQAEGGTKTKAKSEG